MKYSYGITDLIYILQSLYHYRNNYHNRQKYIKIHHGKLENR